ncbi:MAG: diguanylate cyclase [Anaerolineales bacterium]|nr:diguanylate cyclase [Anaerolineales bacterium]
MAANSGGRPWPVWALPLAGAGLGLALAGLAGWLDPAGRPAGWLAALAPLALGLLGYQVARRQAAEAAAVRATAAAERERQLSATITEAMSEGLVLEDAQGRMQLISPSLLKLLDYTAGELTGQHWSRIVAPDSQLVVAEQTARRPGGVAGSYEARLLAKDGYEIPVLVSAMPLQREGQYAGTLAVLVNITERLRTEAALQRVNDYLSHSLNELQQRNTELGLLSELSETLQSCRTSAEAQVVLARLLPRLLPVGSGVIYLVEPGHQQAEPAAAWGEAPAPPSSLALDECWALRRGRPHLTPAGEAEGACPHLAPAPGAGLCVPLLVQGTAFGLLSLRLDGPAAAQEGQQRLAQTVADGVALALSNLQLRETLRQQSIRDALTGMFNRRYMEESLEREMRRAARRGYPVGLIMLDLDHFKDFNDTFGHAAGDLLLRTVGEFLSVHIRAGDVACRYGGEEFVLILPEASLEITRLRAEHLREELHHLNPEYRGQRLGPITVSAGVAAYPAHGQTAERLLRAADDALYQAKRGGRDQVAAAPASGEPEASEATERSL